MVRGAPCDRDAPSMAEHPRSRRRERASKLPAIVDGLLSGDAARRRVRPVQLRQSDLQQVHRASDDQLNPRHECGDADAEGRDPHLGTAVAFSNGYVDARTAPGQP